MRVNKTWTWSFYSRLHRHQNEIALAITYYKPFSFSLTVGEWSWSFGIGSDDGLDLTWYGPFLSYVMSSDRAVPGYWTAGISGNHYWESH